MANSGATHDIAKVLLWKVICLFHELIRELVWISTFLASFSEVVISHFRCTDVDNFVVWHL